LNAFKISANVQHFYQYRFQNPFSKIQTFGLVVSLIWPLYPADAPLTHHSSLEDLPPLTGHRRRSLKPARTLDTAAAPWNPPPDPGHRRRSLEPAARTLDTAAAPWNPLPDPGHRRRSLEPTARPWTPSPLHGTRRHTMTKNDHCSLDTAAAKAPKNPPTHQEILDPGPQAVSWDCRRNQKTSSPRPCRRNPREP